MKNTQFLKKVASAVGIALGAFALSVAAAGSWTPAPANPPDNNADAPVNVSTSLQQKLGPLYVNTSVTSPAAIGLKAWGESDFNGKVVITNTLGPALQIIDGNQGPGKFLASDSSGNISWQAPSSIKVSTGACTVSGSLTDVSAGGIHNFKCPADRPVMCGIDLQHDYPNNENKIYSDIYCAPVYVVSPLAGVTCSISSPYNNHFTLNVTAVGGVPGDYTLRRSLDGGNTWVTTGDSSYVTVSSRGTYTVMAKATETSTGNSFTSSCGTFTY